LDAPGVLHHVIARGIERRAIFLGDADREDFLQRLSVVASPCGLQVFAWALMTNHVHLLVRTGEVPLSRSMRSLLSGYATAFNLRHQRVGHLFQNRFKSIVCEEEPYFLELVRYIHLNPMRCRAVTTVDDLDCYRWTGHAALMGQAPGDWQAVDDVLSHFGSTRRRARERYREFVVAGAGRGRRPDLTGGGLIRSAGGVEAVAELRRGREAYQSDERILGSTEFVNAMRKMAEAAARPDRGVALEDLVKRIAEERGLSPEALVEGGRSRAVAHARSLVSWVRTRHLGRSGRSLAERLAVSPTAVRKGVARIEESGKPGATWLKEICTPSGRPRRLSSGAEGRSGPSRLLTGGR